MQLHKDQKVTQVGSGSQQVVEIMLNWKAHVPSTANCGHGDVLSVNKES